MITVFVVIIPLFCKSRTNINQNKLPSPIDVSGDTISGKEGSVSFSKGKVYHSTHNGRENYGIKAIPPPLIIYIKPLDKEEQENFR